MTFSEFLLIAVLVLILLFLIANVCSLQPVREPEAFCCNCGGIIILSLFLISALVAINREPVAINPKIVTFWNRSFYSSSKAGRQLTDWRKPDIKLPAQEYLMGVELAKNNACHYFDLGRKEDVEQFKRCAHFFPSILAEYTLLYQKSTGVEITLSPL